MCSVFIVCNFEGEKISIPNITDDLSECQALEKVPRQRILKLLLLITVVFGHLELTLQEFYCLEVTHTYI